MVIPETSAAVRASLSGAAGYSGRLLQKYPTGSNRASSSRCRPGSVLFIMHGSDEEESGFQDSPETLVLLGGSVGRFWSSGSEPIRVKVMEAESV